MAHDLYLVQVKTPAESKGAWDLVKLVATVPPDQAFRPLADSPCPLVPKGK
jgi:branched-chain amino acid transport system substrate-binding protein